MPNENRDTAANRRSMKGPSLDGRQSRCDSGKPNSVRELVASLVQSFTEITVTSNRSIRATRLAVFSARSTNRTDVNPVVLDSLFLVGADFKTSMFLMLCATETQPSIRPY